jgi:hypothetical protein
MSGTHLHGTPRQINASQIDDADVPAVTVDTVGPFSHSLGAYFCLFASSIGVGGISKIWMCP